MELRAKLTLQVLETERSLQAPVARAAGAHAVGSEADLGEEVARVLEPEAGVAVGDALHRDHGVVVPEDEDLDLIRAVAVPPGLDVDLGARLCLGDEHGAKRKDLGGLHGFSELTWGPA